MTSTWVVQSNLPNSNTLTLLRTACQKLKLPFHPVHIAPRQPAFPNDLPSRPLIPHGATTLVKLALADNRFNCGVFYTPENFCHSAYQKGFGAAYLNAEAELLSWDLAIRTISKQRNLFIKPPDDLKAFTGFVATESSLLALRQNLANRPYLMPDSVVVGRCYEVDAEWRLFVVERQVVSGSMYRPTGESGIPNGLLKFAHEAINRWCPAPIFVLDIGRVDSRWKIIECNCFNWSRLYNSNVSAIVEAVTDYQTRSLK